MATIFKKNRLFSEKNRSPDEFCKWLTVIANYSNTRRNHDAKNFISSVRRVFQEENLAYEIDDSGSVRPLIDSAFHAERQSTIKSLNHPRYEISAAKVQEVDRYLLESPSDYIMAIRSVFGACENLFKLTYEKPKLDAKAARDNLSIDCKSLYSAHPVLLRANAKSLAGLWTG